MRKEGFQTLVAVLRRITAEGEPEFQVIREDNNLEITLAGVGEASGSFVTLEDEEEIMEGFPLGLNSYGGKEAKRIYDQLEGISDIFYAEYLYIEPKYRSGGYGKKLFQKLEEEAKKEKVDAIIGNAAPMGQDQVPFSVLKKIYTSLGYEFLTIYENKNGLIIKRF